MNIAWGIVLMLLYDVAVEYDRLMTDERKADYRLKAGLITRDQYDATMLVLAQGKAEWLAESPNTRLSEPVLRWALANTLDEFGWAMQDSPFLLGELD
jgi:hypothetical protein